MRRWAWPAALCLLFALLCLGGSDWWQALRYDRAALADGQWWRLVSAHAVHLGWAHAALNMTGVVLCSWLAPHLFMRWKSLAGLLALETLGISVLLWLFSPQVGNYVGFSGVLYGLFFVGLWPQRRDPVMAVALLMVCGWGLWQWLGQPMASEERMIGGHVVSVAHVYGALLGAGWLVLQALRDRPK